MSAANLPRLRAATTATSTARTRRFWRITSNHSEGVCIEGKISVALKGCTLSVTNDSINGNANFSNAATGTLNNYTGHVFHVTNTSAVISLDGVTINDSGDIVNLDRRGHSQRQPRRHRQMVLDGRHLHQLLHGHRRQCQNPHPAITISTSTTWH